MRTPTRPAKKSNAACQETYAVVLDTRKSSKQWNRSPTPSPNNPKLVQLQR